MSTLILTQAEIKELCDLSALIVPLKQAFIAHSTRTGIVPQRLGSSLPQADASATALLPGLLESIPLYSVKVHSKFPGSQPATKGAILLFDQTTGDLKAVLESSLITAMRTGLVSALATHTLAREDAWNVALIGAGQQGRWQLRCLAMLRPLDQVVVYDSNPFAAGTFVAEMARELDAKFIPVANLSEALFDASIVLCATWSSFPFLFDGMLNEGTHVTSLGADELGKTELSEDLIAGSSYFCDDRRLTLEQGTLATLGLDENTLSAELGEVLAGLKPGRSYAEEQTLFTSIGLAWQDLLLAYQVYERAMTQGVGLTLRLS
ncbi:MAG: ornithine cyclodeaminase family protein [Trueperaceae bacterium]|nr:ornithine cyclodeaminase family protein [Trueperaceae bacterium]